MFIQLAKLWSMLMRCSVRTRRGTLARGPQTYLEQAANQSISVIGKSFAIAVPVTALLAYIVWSCVKSYRTNKKAKKLAESWDEDLKAMIASKSQGGKPDDLKKQAEELKAEWRPLVMAPSKARTLDAAELKRQADELRAIWRPSLVQPHQTSMLPSQ